MATLTEVLVQAVAPLARAVREATEMPRDLVDAIYAHLDGYVGRPFDGSRPHTDRVAISLERRFAVLIVFFVDTDGTLNVVSLEAAAAPGGPSSAG